MDRRPCQTGTPGSPEKDAERAFESLVSCILRHGRRCPEIPEHILACALSMRFQGKTPLLLAAEAGNDEAARLCLRPGWVWQRDSEGCGALLLAARRGHAGTFFELLDRASLEQGPEWAWREGRKILKKIKHAPMCQKMVRPLESAIEKYQIQCDAQPPCASAAPRSRPCL